MGSPEVQMQQTKLQEYVISSTLVLQVFVLVCCIFFLAFPFDVFAFCTLYLSFVLQGCRFFCVCLLDLHLRTACFCFCVLYLHFRAASFCFHVFFFVCFRILHPSATVVNPQPTPRARAIWGHVAQANGKNEYTHWHKHMHTGWRERGKRRWRR